MAKEALSRILSIFLNSQNIYHKIPIISLKLIKGFFAGLIFWRAYFWRGLLSEGVLRFKWVGLDDKKTA